MIRLISQLWALLEEKLVHIEPSSYRFMFPANVEYETISKLVADGVFPTVSQLLPAVKYAILLSIIRYVLHYAFFKPFAIFAMKLQPVDFKSVEKIESCLKDQSAVTKESKKMKSSEKVFDVDIIAEKTKFPKPDIHFYLKNRRRKSIFDKKIVKFVEALWRFIFYSVFLVVGFRTLFLPQPVSWVKDSTRYWTDNWPYQDISKSVTFYYLVELGAYLHQLAWTEVSRADALEMILHHFVTILLIVFSYLTNFTRIGSIILILHDSADVFLESAKCFNYASKAEGRKWASNVCDILFAFFAITFFITRLVLYPRLILWGVIVVAPQTNFPFNEFFYAYMVFGGLLIVLQLLHIFWFYLIAKMIYRLFTTGIEKDERSDDEEETEEKTD